MADAQNLKEPFQQPDKPSLSKQAWHQVGRDSMLDELLRDIRTEKILDGNHIPEVVIGLTQKRQAEVCKLQAATKRLGVKDIAAAMTLHEASAQM